MRPPNLIARAKRAVKRQPPVPADGTYMTDGASLFRVASTLVDLNNNPLVELEDCRTLELLLLPAARAMGLGLRPVGAPQCTPG